MNNERKFSDLFYNAVTYIGVIIALLVVIVEVFLFGIDFFADHGNTYIQLFTYLILPGFLFLGLALIPIGVFWKKKRLESGKPMFELQNFRIDLALPHHRNFLLVFICGTAVLVLMTLVGSYQAYHYTESVSFCGQLCHKVMHPEFTAYQRSPHGRVKCVECHIGPGASWFVKSKASGLRQVFKTALNTYEKPIAVPIENLRPAEETCKQCHWPGKFFSTMDFRRSYFLSQGDNPRWNLRLLLNVGGGKDQTYGVHAHMNLNSEIDYVPDDGKRQKISWVKSVGPDGKETIYVTGKSPYKDKAPDQNLIRRMDCIDCHNRPTHIYRSPARLLNDAMKLGQIDAGIPEIKPQAIQLMAGQYENEEDARKTIRDSLLKYYSESQREYFEKNKALVETAVARVEELYSENMFPRMAARWDKFPDNIGHMESPGCFRCHDGKHRSSDGKVITNDCRSCHLIVEQGPAGAETKNIDGLDFEHPDGGDDWQGTPCFDCHTGGADF